MGVVSPINILMKCKGANREHDISKYVAVTECEFAILSGRRDEIARRIISGISDIE
jgi:hypothetical protein